MRYIVYIDNTAEADAIRFVGSYRPRGIFRREQISYTTDISHAFLFDDSDTRTVEKALARAEKDFPLCRCAVCDMGLFAAEHKDNVFWVTARIGENGGEDEYYSHTIGGTAVWTNDIRQAELCLDGDDAESALSLLRMRCNGKITTFAVYANIRNVLAAQKFIIVCKSRNSGVSKYYSRMEGGNRLRLVRTSDAARRFAYREAITEFEHLKSHNKRFFYTVMKAPDENVPSRDIEEYADSHRDLRVVALNDKLKWHRRRD